MIDRGHIAGAQHDVSGACLIKVKKKNLWFLSAVKQFYTTFNIILTQQNIK